MVASTIGQRPPRRIAHPKSPVRFPPIRQRQRQAAPAARSGPSSRPIRPRGGQKWDIRSSTGNSGRAPWNAGRIIGAKRALKPQQVWAIRFWLDRERRLRDRALFNLAIDSKLRGCDVVKIRIGELVSGGRVRTRGIVTQKTGRPVQLDLLEAARSSLQAWLECRGETLDDCAFLSRTDYSRHMLLM